MSDSGNVFQRMGRVVSGVFSGRGLTHRGIVSGIEAEAIALQKGGSDPVVEAPSLITAFASSYTAAWTLPRVLTRESKAREALRRDLAAGHGHYVQVVTASRMFLAKLNLPVLQAEYEKVLSVAGTARTVFRSHHLPAFFYYATLVIVAIVDFQFFFSLLMDVQAASPKSPGYVLVIIQSAGLALFTPLAVIVVGEWGGRRFARVRAEVRDWLDTPTTGTADEGGVASGRRVDRWVLAGELVVPVLVLVCLASLMGLFFAFAVHRFTGLTTTPGAINVDPNLLALLIAVLPLVAFLASTFHHDLATTHRNTTLASWESVQATMGSNQVAVNDAMQRWQGAWDALAAKANEMIAEGHISIQTWEYLVLQGLARVNQRGLTAFSLKSVMSAPSTGTETSDRFAAVAEKGYLPIELPTRQRATPFTAADWVLNELDADLQALIRYQPTHGGATETDVARLLTLARPTPPTLPEETPTTPATAGADHQPSALDDNDDADQNDERFTVDTVDTAELEALMDDNPHPHP